MEFCVMPHKRNHIKPKVYDIQGGCSICLSTVTKFPMPTKSSYQSCCRHMVRWSFCLPLNYPYCSCWHMVRFHPSVFEAWVSDKFLLVRVYLCNNHMRFAVLFLTLQSGPSASIPSLSARVTFPAI
jgi:hypothetical protein